MGRFSVWWNNFGVGVVLAGAVVITVKVTEWVIGMF